MRNTLVTGADRGLGAALAQAAAARGDRVWAACLGSEAKLRANGIEVIPGIDVSSDELVAKLAGAVGPHKIDRLLSNAGINHGSGGPGDADTTKMLNEFNVNVLGGIRVVRTLLPLLAPGARLGFISTGRGAAQVNPDPANGMNYGYRITKAGLNMYVALLAQDLRDAGYIVALLNPGPINTDLMRRIAAAGGSSIDPSSLPSPEDVAGDLLNVLEELPERRSGSWLGHDGQDV